MAAATPRRAIAQPLRPSIPAALATEFAAERRAKTAQATWFGTMIDVVLYPTMTVVDRVAYPEFLASFLPLRVTGFVVSLALLAIQWQVRRRGSDLLERHAYAFAVVFLALNGLGLDLFALIPGGPETQYYAGIMLLLVGVVSVYPWRPIVSFLACLGIVLQFDVFCVVLDPSISEKGYAIANAFYVSTIFIGVVGTVLQERLRVLEFLRRKEVEQERAASEDLLENILPTDIAQELKARGRVTARNVASCSILFADFVGFTSIALRVPAEDLVRSLDRVFSRFDEIADRHGLEKLKTIGDGYMCACGVTSPRRDHLLRSLLTGLEMLRVLEDEGLRAADGSAWRVRIGVHEGPVVAGVIGRRRFAFDLWGSTVNTASRLESHAEPHTINVSTPQYRTVERFFEGTDRGSLPVRGHGEIPMTGICRLRPGYAADAAGRTPNDRFWRDAGLVPPRGAC